MNESVAEMRNNLQGDELFSLEVSYFRGESR